MQTSISAWLTKPATIKEPPQAQINSPASKNERQQQPSVLPTPPPEDVAAPSTTIAYAQNATVVPIADEEIALDEQQPPHRQQLHPNVTLERITKATLQQFKRINSILLPIPYSTKFYNETLDDPVTASISLVAIWHDTPRSSPPSAKAAAKVIGGIRCRILTHPAADTTQSTNSKPMLYISTLTLLSPYRTHGIASALLDAVLATAVRDHGVEAVGAHVWEANGEGTTWYAARGFEEVGREEAYYRRLEPMAAIVVRKEIGRDEGARDGG